MTALRLLTTAPLFVAIAASSTGVATPIEQAAPALPFTQLAAQCAPSIHVRTIASLVRQESRLNPYAIGVNGGPPLQRQPTNTAEAVAMARMLLAQGDDIDVGLGQINSANFGWLGLSLPQLFDPCDNLRAAARVLSDCYARGGAVWGEGQQALQAALSCYNTGSLSAGLANGYVRKVAAQAALPVPELLPLAPETRGNTGGSNLSPPPEPRNAAATSHPHTGIRKGTDRQKTKEPDVFGSSDDVDIFAVPKETN